MYCRSKLEVWLIHTFVAKAIKSTYIYDDKTQAANNEGVRYELG